MIKLEPLPRFFPLERAIALSDAVFAVVMTVLVLGIDVPQGETLSGPQLASVLERLGHQALIYFVSFALIAMYWSQHSMLFAGLRRMDRPTMLLNLVFLLPVTLLPFVTQLMGTWRGSWEVVAGFAVANLFAAHMFSRLWKHVAAQPDLHAGPQTLALSRRIRVGLRFYTVVMIVGVLLALINVRIGILCFVLMPLAHFYNYVRDPLRASDEPAPTDEPSAP